MQYKSVDSRKSAHKHARIVYVQWRELKHAVLSRNPDKYNVLVCGIVPSAVFLRRVSRICIAVS